MMIARDESRDGFSVLDGAAVVIGGRGRLGPHPRRHWET